MPDIIRLHTPRTPETVAKSDYGKIGINSHPANYQSNTYTSWHQLCLHGEHAAVVKEMSAFLTPGRAILSPDDYTPEVRSVIDQLRREGANPTNKENQFINERSGATILKREVLFEAITKTADSLLAASVLKVAGAIRKVNLQENLKLLFYADRLQTSKRFPVKEFERYTRKHILLPHCFFPIDPCKAEKERHFIGGIDAMNEFKIKMPRDTTANSDCGCVDNGDCKCLPNNKCVDQDPCCATIKPYPTDLMIVKEEISYYAPAELSYIENILMGEKRNRTHRHLDRTEEYTEREIEVSNYEERDHQVTERFELRKEASEVVKQDLSVEAGVTYNYHMGTKKAGYEITANTNASFSYSKEKAQKLAQDYSRDVVDRSITKIENRMRELVTTKRIVENEETNEHGFDNTGGSENIAGQYFYINKISQGQVYSYGRRLVCDFLVPEPAALHKHLLEAQFKLKEPQKPAIKPSDIKPENFESLITQYDLRDAEFPPQFATDIKLRFYHDGGETRGASTAVQTAAIPADYAAIWMSSVEATSISWNKHGLSIAIDLAPQSLQYIEADSSQNRTWVAFNPPFPEGAHDVVVTSYGASLYHFIVTIHCELKAEVKLKWQLKIYQQIMEAYEAQLKAYNEALAEFERTKKKTQQRNPFINREIERTELKRMAISYISCQFFDAMDAMKARAKPCGYPEMSLAEAEKEGRFVQFFEQAFEWGLMTYLFYPYYWGRKCTWDVKLKEEADDPIFEQFLRSGFAKVQVPIRPGFEEQVLYFTANGEIWLGQDTPPLPGDSYYVSMAQEIREQKGNFYTDREGSLSVTKGSNIVTLTGTDHYWYAGDPLATPPVPAGVDQLNINSDIDREIIINCKVYRIVSIQEDTSDPNHTTWTIKLERAYEADDATDLKWSTGAIFVGAPWEFATPTKLVWLREKSKCLPKFPIKPCEE